MREEVNKSKDIFYIKESGENSVSKSELPPSKLSAKKVPHVIKICDLRYNKILLFKNV